jgi:hypothetical protein
MQTRFEHDATGDRTVGGVGLLSFVRRHRPTDIRHTFVCGATRSGKSEAELARLVPLARRNNCAIVLLDPPGTLARKFLLHLHRIGQASRVLYDRLSDTDRVPGYEWLLPSNNADPLQREAENDERVREFASILLRRRGIQDAAARPLIEETVLAALRLFVAQASPVSLPWAADAFDVWSKARAHMLANCTEPSVVRKFHELAALSPTLRRTETAPAERILRGVLGSPAFRVRSSGVATFDLPRLLDARGIVILDGGSSGNLSRDAASVMMGAVILRVIQHCRTGAACRIVLVLDEAANANLIGLYESQALAEAGKWGLEFHILVQDPFGFPSPEIRSNVLQNCWRHEWFRQGSSDAARLAAEDVAIPVLDPLRVHHTEYRTRTADAGYERVRIESGSESFDRHGAAIQTTRNRSEALWPRRREVRDPQERFTTLADQVTLTQREMMLLGTGYRIVRDDGVSARPEYVRQLRDPWAARKSNWLCRVADPSNECEAFRRTLASLKESPFYREPPVSAAARMAPSSSVSAAERLRRQ